MKRIIAATIILFGFSFPVLGQSLAEHHVDRVLFLSSYHPEFSSFDRQVAGIKAGLVESGLASKDFILDIEFMDTKRFPPEQMIPKFQVLLRHKLSVLPPYDIVIVADDNATRFAVENQKTLFKNRPLVFFAVNNVHFAQAQNANPLVTGVVEAVSIQETLDLISRIRPKTDKPPVIISDATPSGRGTLRSVLDLHPEFSDNIIDVSTLTYRQLFASLEKLSSADNVLLLSASRDTEGASMNYPEQISAMRKVLKAPIFWLWHHCIDDGALGGVVVSHFEQGRKAGNMAGAILKGSNISDMPVIEESPNITTINYDVMQQFDIDPSLLPSDTVFLNKPISLYGQYKFEINTLAAVLLLLVIFSGTLSIYVLRLRSARFNLKESKTRLQTIYDAADNIAFITTDLGGEDTRILDFNVGAEKIFGYTAEEMVGQKIALLHRPDDVKNFPLMQQKIKDEEKGASGDAVLVRKSGECFPALFTVHSLMSGGGEIVGTVWVSIDITDRKRAEEERNIIEDKLRQSQKMEAVGQLAGGIAHDFNNMLGAIIGSAELLLSPQRGLDAKGAKYVHMISKSAERAADLTAKLLSFGRKGPGDFSPIDIHVVLDDMLGILDKTIDKKISTAISKDATHSVVSGNHSALQNMMLNLGINASHAMLNGGKIEISTRNTTLSHAYCATCAFSITPGQYIGIDFRDTGSGIAPENLQKIFEPFFTTKEPGEGTGLGLAASYGTVQDHHGAITVYSEVGVGTVFHLYLPCAEDQTPRKERKPSLTYGVGTILLVDDEEDIRVTSEAILEDLGYQVFVAEDGKKAVELFQNHHEEIDLVIMDMIMPVMNGEEAFYEMKRIDEHCRIMIASGFTKDASLAEMYQAGLIGFVQKPYLSAKLSEIVAGVIGRS